MLSSTFALAPAGVVGRGIDPRPGACTAVRPSLLPTAAVVGGTRVPAAGMVRRRTAWELAGVEGARTTTALRITAQHDPNTKNDGTTPLGIHPRGRSTS